MRYGVHSNSYQGSFKRVVTVCSANMLRSPTMAEVLSREPYNFNTRSCGIAPYALIKFDIELAMWADEIVCADTEHTLHVRDFLMREYLDKPIIDLKIPDNYEFRNPDLIDMIKERYDARTGK